MDKKMLLVLPVSPHEVDAAHKLLKLWADMEDAFNPAISVLVFQRFDMRGKNLISKDVVCYVSKKFHIHVEVCDRVGLGWPAGCNALEVGAYEWFFENNRNRRINFEYMLIAEPDTVPLRKGWANEIMEEAYANNSVMLGASFTQQDGCPHINGNCVMHKNLWKKIPEIWRVPSRIGWDCYIGRRAIVIGTASKLIWQDYRLGTPDNPWKGDDFIFEKKVHKNNQNPLFGQELSPAMFHGIKTIDGINAVRRRILGESC